MKSRSPALISALIIAVLIIGGVAYLGRSRGLILPRSEPTPTSEAMTWDVPPGSIPQAEEEKLKEAVRAKWVKQTTEDTYTSIVGATVSGDWALLHAQEKAKTPQQLQPEEPFEVLGHKIQTGWQIVTPDDARFCQLLKEAPDSLTDKDYYVGCRSQ